MTTTSPQVPGVAQEAKRHPAASWSITTRSAAALTLVLSFGLHLVSLAIIRLGHPDLGHGGNLEDFLTWVAADPTSASISKTLDVLFVPFAVGAVVVYVALGRVRSPRLAWVGGLLYGGGLVCLATMEGYEAFAYQIAIDGALSPADLVDSFTSAMSPAYGVAQAVFLLGVTLGLPITAAALWRSQVVPRAACVGLVLFLVGELSGFRLAGHLIGLVSTAWIAVTILRTARAMHHRIRGAVAASGA